MEKKNTETPSTTNCVNSGPATIGGGRRFTLDEEYVEAVLQAFARFAEKGWIYRGTRMINWCPQCRTVISDLETEEREVAGHLWHIRYPVQEGVLQVVVATTRPETMLGDTAVAVHPNDDRWREAIGLQVELPLTDRVIPIVADEYADPELGSGAVKVTPAHDPNDYELGLRHGLPQIQVIGFDGVMTEAAGRFAGLDRYAAREAVVAALEAEGLLAKIENHQHAVPHHDKCGTVVEPLPMEQWFMNMKELAAKARPVLVQQEIQLRARPLPPLCHRVVGPNTRLGLVAADFGGGIAFPLGIAPIAVPMG